MVLMAFLLMLSIHARNILWGMTKCPSVDATSETLIQGHSKVKHVHFHIRFAIRWFILLCMLSKSV